MGDLHPGQVARPPPALSLAKSAAESDPVLPHAGHFSRTRSSREGAPSAAAATAFASSTQVA